MSSFGTVVGVSGQFLHRIDPKSTTPFQGLLSAAASSSNDDLFGMYFDGLVPSNTQGIRLTFSINTNHVSCTSNSGWVAVVDTAHIAGGSPDEALLQASVALSCTGSGASQWNVQYGWYDNNGAGHFGYTLASYSTSQYPSLSGTVSIFYTGSAWEEQTYIFTIGQMWSYTYPSIQGTVFDGGSQDWVAVETDAYQNGIAFYSGFSWTETGIEWYTGGSWTAYNYISGPNYYLKAYADYQPLYAYNALDVKQTGSGFESGVNVYYYGSSPPDTHGNQWYLLLTSSAASYYVNVDCGGGGSCSSSGFWASSGQQYTLYIWPSNGYWLNDVIGQYGGPIGYSGASSGLSSGGVSSGTGTTTGVWDWYTPNWGGYGWYGWACASQATENGWTYCTAGGSNTGEYELTITVYGSASLNVLFKPFFGPSALSETTKDHQSFSFTVNSNFNVGPTPFYIGIYNTEYGGPWSDQFTAAQDGYPLISYTGSGTSLSGNDYHYWVGDGSNFTVESPRKFPECRL